MPLTKQQHHNLTEFLLHPLAWTDTAKVDMCRLARTYIKDLETRGLPMTEVQMHNIEQFLNDPADWTIEAKRQICADIKQRMNALENMQLMLKDVLAEMKDDGASGSYWAYRIEQALANGQ